MRGARRLGTANAVTLVRAVLQLPLAVLVLAAPVSGRWAIAAVATVALLLDGVDGWVARRTATATPEGARFDMEVDAALVLVLSVHVAGRLDAGWVLLIGLARYLLSAAAWVAPWVGSPVPQRSWRKVVAVAQVVALVVAGTGVLPGGVGRWVVAVAGAGLLVSFLTQVWEVRHARPEPSPWRAAALTVVAAVVAWVVLAAPDDPVGGARSWAGLPVEAVVLVALVLLAALGPRWSGVLVGVLVGVALAGVAVLRAADVGFRIALGRRSDPWTDIGYAGSAVHGALDAYGPLLGSTLVGLVGLGAAGLVLAVGWSGWRVARFVERRRRSSARWVVAAGAAWALTAIVGSAAAVVAPAADRATLGLIATHVDQVRDNLRDAEGFGRLLSADPLAPATGARVPAALAGKDVLVVFVESYGRHAVEHSPAVAVALGRGSATLARAGFGTRSAFVTSPTFGGLSWLAHATLQSGLWVDREGRHDQLLASRRTTLTGLFARSGWRTACVIPANRHDWSPARTFYGCDTTYDARTLGYRGPAYGYPPVPDQFTLAALGRSELGPGHRPVMAEVDLVTSHAPWSPLPPTIPWSELGDGTAYATAAAPAAPPGGEQAAYGAAVAYSLDSLVDFVAAADDRDLVVLALGDHQPHAGVSGANADHDVPVSVIARDPAALAALTARGWSPGLRPLTKAPVGRMDEARDWFLDAFEKG